MRKGSSCLTFHILWQHLCLKTAGTTIQFSTRTNLSLSTWIQRQLYSCTIIVTRRSKWASQYVHSYMLRPVYHFDLDDPSRTCVNPSPPSPESRHVRFPTLPVFCDALVETSHSPPLPFIHSKSQMLLKIFLDYLTSLPLSSSSEADYLESQGDKSEQVLNPKYFDILSGMKEENRPYLLRSCLDVPCLLLEDSTREREVMREVRCRRMGVPYLPPTRAAPYNPLYRARGNKYLPQGPYLTPHLVPFGATAKIEWRSLSKGASMIVKRMIY